MIRFLSYDDDLLQLSIICFKNNTYRLNDINKFLEASCFMSFGIICLFIKDR